MSGSKAAGLRASYQTDSCEAQRDLVGHTCTHRGSYHRNYTSERGQGSLWNWGKETGNVTQGRRAGRVNGERKRTGGGAS